MENYAQKNCTAYIIVILFESYFVTQHLLNYRNVTYLTHKQVPQAILMGYMTEFRNGIFIT